MVFSFQSTFSKYAVYLQITNSFHGLDTLRALKCLIKTISYYVEEGKHLKEADGLYELADNVSIQLLLTTLVTDFSSAFHESMKPF